MATFHDLQSHLSKNPTFIGELLNDPKAALEKAHLELKDEKDIKRLETFVGLANLNVNAAAKLAGFHPPFKAGWGIGAGCCNGQTLFTSMGDPAPER